MLHSFDWQVLNFTLQNYKNYSYHTLVKKYSQSVLNERIEKQLPKKKKLLLNKA